MYYFSMITIKSGLYFALVCLLFSSCRKEMVDNKEELLNFKLVSRSLESVETIKQVDIFLLQDGRLADKYTRLGASENGTYPILVPDPQNSRLLFLVNGNIPMETGSTTSESFLSQTTPAVDYVQKRPLLFYTGDPNLAGVTEPMIMVPILRSLARLSVQMQTDVNIKIDSCVITNIADRSHIFPFPGKSPADLKLISASLGTSHFTVSPTTPQVGFFYLYESENANSKVIFFAKINGIRNQLEVALPAKIERNKDYSIIINSRGATVFTSLDILPWEKGAELDATPAPFAPVVENVESTPPNAISLNTRGDTISVPAGSASCVVGIKADVQVELRAESDIAIEPVGTESRSVYMGNRFKLTFTDKNINEAPTYTRIYIKDQSASRYYDQYVVIARSASRTRVEALHPKAKIRGRTVSFDGYIDGMIADITFSSPPSKVASLSDDSDFNWLRLDPHETAGRYRIQGGFKPNDTAAKGQIQASVIRVEYPDGLVEEMKFTRKRHSLPVVLIAGKYWSKFNMRGDSKSYDDQVGFDKDQNDLFAYLKTCPNEKYLYYAGASYKGHSRQGMYLQRKANGQLSYPEYATYGSGSTTNASPSLHCPEGYELPHKNDFEALMGKGTLNLPDNEQERSYTSVRGAYKIERYMRRDITIGNKPIAGMYHVKVTEVSTGNKFVWTGTGHQWSSNNEVALNHWIYALVNPGSSNYYTFIHGDNRAKMELQNNDKTRSVRCIKSSVNYIL